MAFFLAVNKGWSLFAALVSCLVLATTGCGGAPSNEREPGSNVSIDVGKSEGYRLYTHCGVLSATINGQTFYANPPLSDGNGNPPSGWGNPYDDGVMSLRSPTVADFRDSAGHTAHFIAAPPGPTPRIPVCS